MDLTNRMTATDLRSRKTTGWLPIDAGEQALNTRTEDRKVFQVLSKVRCVEPGREKTRTRGRDQL